MICHDLYAGLGGTTAGIEMAGGTVTHAANHNAHALHLHQLNHPDVQHYRQNLVDTSHFDWDRPDITFASPSCKWFTRASGGRIVVDHSRGTAHAVLTYCEDVRPPIIVVENVPDFLNWSCYRGWTVCLEDLGYTLNVHRINAKDCGAPQDRERLFIIGTQSNAPLELKLKAHPQVTARQYVDLDLTHNKWRHQENYVIKTRQRLEAARQYQQADQFLFCYYSSGSGWTGRSLDRPVGTIPGADVWAVVNWPYMRMLTVRELANLMGFADTYRLEGNRAQLTHMIGNAVCPPVSRAITEAIMEAC